MYFIYRYIYTHSINMKAMNSVNQLIFVWKNFLRGTREPHWHEYFLPQTSVCLVVVIKKTGGDKAWLQKLVAANQLISNQSWNKVVANNSWFTVIIVQCYSSRVSFTYQINTPEAITKLMKCGGFNQPKLSILSFLPYATDGLTLARFHIPTQLYKNI